MMKKKLLLCLSALLLLLSFSACAEPAADTSAWQAYSGKRIGVQVGTTSGQQVKAKIPDAVLLYYNTQTDLLAALRAGKIDMMASDESFFRYLLMECDDLTILDGYLATFEYAPIFAKTNEGYTLRDQYSAFVDSLWENGTLLELDEIWHGRDEAKRTVLDYESLPDTNGTLYMAVDTSVIPFSYVKDNRVVGYDVDIAARFCREYGYRLQVMPMDFGGLLPAVQSGRVDFAACAITVTEERKESVLFGAPDYKAGAVLAVLNDRAAQAPENTAVPGSAQADSSITSFAQLAEPGTRIAIGLNTPAEQTLREDYPEAVLVPYSDIFLAYMDVDKGRVDACVAARKEMEFAIRNGLSGVRLLEENYALNKIAVGISPVTSIPDLKGKLNTFIAESRADGTLDDMYERWVLRGEEAMPDIPPAENPSFTLRVGTTGSVMPYSYYVGTELAGYDIELAHRFAAWLGAKPEFAVFDFGGIVPAAEAGRIDCIMSNLFYSEERNEGIPFSDVLFEVEITAMVRDREQPASATANGALKQLDGKRIGAATGTTFDAIVRKALPEAEIAYINSAADLIAALEAGKIDGFAVDEPAARQFCRENPRLAMLDEYMDTFEFGFVLPKTAEGEALLEELDAWLVSMKADGSLEQVIEKWTNGPEEEKTLPGYEAFPAPKGILTLATEGDYVPMTYYRGNEIVGAEIDLAARFCEAYGYGLEIKVMNFDGILPAVQSGKADIAAAGITITDERRESVNFSVPYYAGGTVMVVLKSSQTPASGSGRPESDPSGRTGFIESIRSSFDKTFIRENRWQLFVDGILTTLLITVLSILFGTALGFLVFMLCRNGNAFANGATRFCVWLVQGMPMVVLLMVLYYIVFGSVAINGIAVAVIGFTLTFGSAVFSLLKMGVGTIDRGQYEAAYALGHSNRRTFFRIILPQAIPHILPAYQGEIAGLIKATAIVGYVAVQDLTKMGDIVRSRTYEAFFPLIAITIIYFVLEGLFSLAVSRISISIDPRKRRRERILKGVNTHD